MITTAIVWVHLTNVLYSRIFQLPITIGAWIVVGIILFSMLDYLDIIKYRKSHDRLTKCAVCDRTSKLRKFEESKKLIKTKVKGKDEDGDKYKEKAETEELTDSEVPENPLHGIIVYDKMICNDCTKKIREMFKV